MEQVLGHLLRVGVIVSALVTLLGGIVYLVHHGREPCDYSRFHGEPPEFRSPREIVIRALDVRHFQGRAIIQLGLLLLIATPVARVVFSAIGFVCQGDLTYVVATLIVLTTLLYSLFSG